MPAAIRLLLVLPLLLLAACHTAAVQEFPLTKFKAEAALDRGIRDMTTVTIGWPLAPSRARSMPG